MPAKATVRNEIDPNKRATVWLKADNHAEDLKISSLLLDENIELEVFTPEGQRYPRKTNIAWESACFSGILFVRKRIKTNKVKVTVTRIAGRLERWDATGFAIAASAAFLCEMGSSESMSEKECQGWRIEIVEKE